MERLESLAPKLSSWLLDRPESWPDVMAPIWLLPRFVSSPEPRAPRPATERPPIWVAERPVMVSDARAPMAAEERVPTWVALRLATTPGEVGRAQAVELGRGEALELARGEAGELGAEVVELAARQAESWPDVMAPIWLLPRFVSSPEPRAPRPAAGEAADLGRGETRDGVGREGPRWPRRRGCRPWVALRLATTLVRSAELRLLSWVEDEALELARGEAGELGAEVVELAARQAGELARRDGADLAAAEVREFAGAEGAEAGHPTGRRSGSRRRPVMVSGREGPDGRGGEGADLGGR